MYANPSLIPSVQVGQGIPLQSSSVAVPQASMLPAQASAIAQSSIQQNMAPVQSGSIMQLPPGTMVPVRVGNSIVQVPTQPVQVQTVQPQYQIQSVQVPTPPPVETQYVQQEISLPPNTYPTTQYQGTTTPQLKTLQPKLVRNELPPQYKTVTLPPKVVTQRLPPIGPPPTPELNLQSYAMPEPVQTYVPPEPVQTYVPPPQPVQTVMVPQVRTVMVPRVSTVMVPQYQTTSLPVPNYQNATMIQPSAPKFGTTSVVAQY